MPDQRAPRSPGASPLRAGRDRIIAGATSRGLLTGLVAALPAASAALLLSREGTLDAIVAPLLLLMGGSFFALLLGSRARHSWARAWDLQLGLPQTVETTAALARDESAGQEWGRQLLLRAEEIPPPTGVSALLAPSPRLLPALLTTVFAASGAILLPSASTASPPGAPAVGVIDNSGTAGRAPVSEAELRAFEDARRHWRQRHDAALLLADSPALATLADWLEGGGPAPVVAAELTPDQRQRLREAARRLGAGGEVGPGDSLEMAARFLQSIAEGDATDPVELPDASASLREAVSVELARTAGDASPATFRDLDLASGGADRATATEAVEGSEPSAGDDPGVSIGGARPVAPGERSVQDRGGGSTGVASPQWDRVLAHPEVETRWLPAIEAYRQLQQGTGEEPR